MNVIGAILAVAVAIALGVALFLLAVNMLVWNITDMQSVGINFWNMFWTAIAAGMLLGGSSRVAR